MDTENDAELNDMEWVMVDLLAAGYTHEDAAAFIGCSAKTIQRHKRNPAVRRELAQRQAERMSALSSLLTLKTWVAVEAICSELDSEHGPTKLRAAQLILDYSRRYDAGARDLVRDERLDNIEQHLEAIQRTPSVTELIADEEEW